MHVNENCLGCGVCAEVCALEAITIVDSRATIDQELCVGCGLCADACPLEAIEPAA